MSSLYYPYYKLEEISSDKNIRNHRSYINVLSLFSTDILIPCSHILSMTSSKYAILIRNKLLFEKGILYYRLPSNMSDLSEYYLTNKRKFKNTNSKLIKNRVTELCGILPDNIDTYIPENQQANYSDNIKKVIKNYVEEHPRFQGYDTLLTKLNNAETITKENFDNIIDDLYKSSSIKAEHYKNLQIISNILYFVGGASSNNLKICYDDYFEDQKIKDVITPVVSNYDEIICEDYYPPKIIEALKEINVLNDVKDMRLLTAKDIIELRSINTFQKFAQKYCKKASNNKAIEYLKGKKRAISAISAIKRWIISIILTIISAIISYFCSQNLFASIISGLVIFAISEFITYIIMKIDLRIKYISTIFDKIIGFIVPDVLFLYKIQQKLISCKE